jgi:hypothetical protein
MIKQNFRCSLSSAVYSTRLVINQGKTITIVIHEIDDGNWKFLSKEDSEHSENKLVMISLQEILMIDPTIAEISHLREGNLAVRRFVGDTWKISPIKYQPIGPGKLELTESS